MSLVTKILLGVLALFLLVFLVASHRVAALPAFIDKHLRNGVAQASRKQVLLTVLIVIMLGCAVVLSGI